LYLDLKIKVVDRVIEKIQWEIAALQVIVDQTNALRRKLEVYRILLLKLEDFKKSLSD
jgi:hypothetical protein